MSKDSSATKTVGFVSVHKHTELGYFGGLLVLNPLGRPLEFHCTLPMKPTRAQEILYGPTLDSFLCGEQIAFALVNKLKESPEILFTDVQAVLMLRHVCPVPVCCIEVDDSEPSNNHDLDRHDLVSFDIEETTAWLLSNYKSDQENLLKQWRSMGARIELNEPFGRIREALQEANPTTRAA